MVNTTSAATGELAYADAVPIGALDGRVRLISVEFGVVGDPSSLSAVDLEFTSIYQVGDFADLRPGLTVRDGTACVTAFDYRLRLSGGVDTVFSWRSIPGASSYELIRGDLVWLSRDATRVDLGPVDCIANDTRATTVGPDSTRPAPGQGFYYLIRHSSGLQNRTWGFFQDCALERIPLAGDCP
jgi:hypothetical protein